MDGFVDGLTDGTGDGFRVIVPVDGLGDGLADGTGGFRIVPVGLSAGGFTGLIGFNFLNSSFVNTNHHQSVVNQQSTLRRKFAANEPTETSRLEREDDVS